MAAAAVPGAETVKGKGSPLAWAKKHPAGAAGVLGGAGLGAFVLYKRNQANTAADTSGTDTPAPADAGTVGPPASYDGSGGGGSDDSAAFSQLEAQEQSLQQQLSTLTSAKNPPPGVNWYQMAKSLLQRSGDKDPSVKQIDRERRKLLRVLGPAPSTARHPQTTPATRTKKRR